MIDTEKIMLTSIALHHIGNKQNDESIRFSKSELKTSEKINDLLLTYFLAPFKLEEYYNFYHESDLKLNEVFTYVSEIFDDPGSLYTQSVNLAKHLYEQSTHPKIKSGEFYVAYFRDCVVEGETVDAIGLFKSETKDTFLKVFPQGDGFAIESEAGININKLDKGCLIFNTAREEGYLVSVIDTASKGAEAQYWVDHFLHIRQRNDAYFHTSNTLTLCKDFVVNKFPEQFEVSKADQADLLHKSVRFFKEKDHFDLEEFANEVLQEPEAMKSFRQHKSDFEQERDIQLPDNFDISDQAVKKQARNLKSVIKLDKNFHIYIHGDQHKILKGMDPETGMNYYQLFFREES
jgi:hypothetical protein